MSLKETKKFIISVLGIEDQAKWLSAEKVNIFITTLAAPLLALLGTIIKTIIIQDKNSLKSIVQTMGTPWFINSMQLLTIVCTILVIYRLRRKILITREKKLRLFTYIQENCNLRDQSDDNIEKTLHVVQKTMTQFYYVWIMLWTVFFIYYGCSLCFDIFNELNFKYCDNSKLVLLKNGFDNFFDYLSSTIMLVLFIILNSVTVSLKDRRYRNGIVSSVMFIVFFGCVILFPTLYSFSLCRISYIKLQLIIAFIIGLYSAFAFVLVLGKLNTNLQIPRFIFYWLYIYALIQTFQFLLIQVPNFDNMSCYCSEKIGCYYHCLFTTNKTNVCTNKDCVICQLKDYIRILNIFFQYVTLIGKVFLSLTLLWIVYESKFIFFVIQQSQAVTDLPYKTSVFKTYMKDAD